MDAATTAEALAEVWRDLAETPDLAQTIDRVIATLLRLFRARRAVLFEFDPTSASLVCVAAAGPGRPEKWIGKTIPAGVGVAGLAVKEGRAIYSADLLADSRFTLQEWVLERIQEEGYRSAIGVPLRIRGEAIGALTLGDAPGRVFTEEEIGFLCAFADQAALALHNARLYQEIQQRLRRTETLLAVSQSVSATLELTEIMRRVARETARALGADMAGAYLADPDQESLRPIAGYHVPKHLVDAFREFPIPLRGHRLPEEAWNEQRPAFSSDADADPRIDRETFGRFPHRSVLFVPMIVKGKAIGGLFVIWWTQRHVFTPEDLRLVEGISRQAGLAVENARLFTAQKEEAEISAALLKLAEAMEGVQDLDRILETVVRITPELLGLMRCGLFRFEPAEGVLIPAKVWGLPEEFKPAFLALRGSPQIPAVVKAAQSQEPVVVEKDVLHAWIPRKVAFALDIRSMLIIPLVSGGRLMGTMAVDTPGEQRAFTPKQIAIARGIAAHAAVAIDRARLYTETQQAQADLRAAEAQLVRGETLRAVGELAAGMAHHLNNLLAVILLRIQLLLKTVQDPGVRRSLEIVEQTTLDGAEVVRRVQKFSRVQPVSEAVPVDLNRLVHEVLELTRALWQGQAQVRGIDIQTSFEPGEIPEVAGDPAGLREVLMNLLLNAVDAMPQGGRITVRTWALDELVHCSVADTGVGMSEEVCQRVLEPFFTTKGPKSTGLGLSVAYGIIQRHGGELTIESEEGRGTTITFSLPAASVVKSSPTAPPALQASLRILVIDDEVEVLEALAETLAVQGHTVIQAPGGRDGLERLERESVDLVLTDLAMPGMNGWEVARAIKARWPHLPVGIITGWGDEPEATPGEHSRVAFVIAKPLRQEDLLEAIARACPRS